MYMNNNNANKNNNMNILFYSKFCNTCIQLCSLLMKEDMMKFFRVVCVDENLHRLPPQITIVPTMLVQTHTEPIVGPATFKWIEQMKFFKKNNQPTQNSISPNNFTSILKNTGPLPFITSEMSDQISDGFAYKEQDDAIPHRYVTSTLNNQTIIFTAPEEAKIGKTETVKQIKQMEEDRENEAKSFNQLMKQQQINALMNRNQ